MSVYAKRLPTYICEPTNEWAGTSGYEARKIYRNTETVTHYSSAATMFQAIGNDLGLSPGIGGAVHLKNGLYIIDSNLGTSYIIDWSSSAYGAAVQIDLIGENRDNVVIRNAVTATDDKMFGFHCDTRVENITFDGNGVGTIVATLLITGLGRTAYVNNCKFIKNTGFGLQTFDTDANIVTNNVFEDSRTIDYGAGKDDQCGLAIKKYGIVQNNYFDRVTGTDRDDSCLTFGACINTDISGNIIKNSAGPFNHGISLEPFSDNYANINIHDNYLENAMLSVGGSGAFTPTFRNIKVHDNILVGGPLRIIGPDSGDYSTQMKDITVENNTVYNSYEVGIEARNIAGFTTVRNNVVKNSNISLNASSFRYPAIYLNIGTDIVCERNNILMENNANALFSPSGIRYVSLVNPTIQNNRIINRTTANPSYEASGTQTGTINISYSK
jgi:hypothetical protein